MNYIRHLTGFFERVTKDRLLNPTHVSLYIALFQFWNLNRFRNPISISRDELMRISKISSKATYHKCLKLLHEHGYIRYEPSYNPYRGSHVHLFNFADDLKPETKNERAAPPNKPLFKQVHEQVVNKQRTSPEHLDEQAVVPSLNNINLTNLQNSTNAETPAPKNQEEKFEVDVGADEKEKKLREKKKSEFPKIGQVVDFFKQEHFPEFEANKFFNYYESIGWLVGGKAPIVDWPAAARNWITKAPQFEKHDTGTRKLDTSSGKNYSEPL